MLFNSCNLKILMPLVMNVAQGRKVTVKKTRGIWYARIQ